MFYSSNQWKPRTLMAFKLRTHFDKNMKKVQKHTISGLNYMKLSRERNTNNAIIFFSTTDLSQVFGLQFHFRLTN